MSVTIILPITDSDCQVCERRHHEQLSLLAEVRCDLLEDCVCPECGCTFSLAVESDHA